MINISLPSVFKKDAAK